MGNIAGDVSREFHSASENHRNSKAYPFGAHYTLR
jgi:hypothetical protein